jgi:hypothetical protein
MKWLFRPSLLIALSAALVVGAAVVFWQSQRSTRTTPTPLAVAEGDYEIVWLYAATNASAWERFVAALRRGADHLREEFPGLKAEVGPAAFPPQTTAVPEVALELPGGKRRLVFRWYKLTSDWNTHDWIDVLVRRNPPPLAIIGGSSSDVARELTRQVSELTDHMPAAQRPLLLLTTATADRVSQRTTEEIEAISPPHLPGDTEETDVAPGVLLNRIYPGRTFRFCFTNRQMAAAVTHFIWSQEDLRPDADPAYMVQWEDDSYSRDLIDGFWRALRYKVAQSIAREWSWLTANVVCGGFPPHLGGGSFPLHLVGPQVSRFHMSILPNPQIIDSSVGSFAMPNRYEAKVARDLCDLLMPSTPRGSPQQRPLLIVTGQSLPSRRFLRALARSAPGLGPRLVVATGDAIPFNTIYRDRQVAWPIQDLPFPLVFFCHHNPVDPAAGFRPQDSTLAGAGGADTSTRAPGTAATGTEDILLYAEILESLVQATLRDGQPCTGAAQLGERLAAVRLAGTRITYDPAGAPLFKPDGQRYSGTGEHVVCLRPWFQNGRVLPQATIEVWAWRPLERGSLPAQVAGGREHLWQRCSEPLLVSYDEFALEGGGGHGAN